MRYVSVCCVSWMIGLTASAAYADDAADALAKKVVAAAGNPYAMSEIRFDFVVFRDGKEAFRRPHVWHPKKGVAIVGKGDKKVTLTDLHTRKPNPDGKSPEDKAYGAWINDTYWLVAAAKVNDSGVMRSIDKQGRLVLKFKGVGLTPGDTYMLTVDKKTHRVTRWDYVLQGGNESGWSWEGYQQYGPLLISTRRMAVGKNAEIRLDNVRVTP